jgi:nitrogen-specific signal transduction histidine kinase/ActR/RegA family two-component response regulator
MEAETVRLTELLTQSRKLEAVGTLAGGIAHDFNNILMGIQGYASLMLLDIDTTHPFYEKLKAIEDQIKSAADLTGQLLGYARGGRYEVKTTSLNELIGKTASMFGRTKKEIRIHQTFAKDLWTVEADRGQLEQVLLNLFMNAWQAMPGGGALYLQTENVILDEFYVEPFGTAPGPFVKISVTDTGVGMDRETKDRVFEPFFTTKEMGRGTGLGLASAYGIIRGHGGIINVYSEKGYGTTFNFYLPASQKEVIEEMRPAREIIKGNETLLLVDDEKIITDVTAAMITRLGYQILIAHNGEEAVEIYQANPNRVDLVILDMIMPGIGGGKAFDLIQSINPQAKIILSSGFTLNGEAKEIMNRGARAFLQKPFQIDDLSKVIREVLEAV